MYVKNFNFLNFSERIMDQIHVLYEYILFDNSHLFFCIKGTDIYNALVEAAKKGIKLRIVQNAQKNNETRTLESEGLAKVRSLNFSNWFDSGKLIK